MKLAGGAFDGPYSFSSRFEDGKGTNPEELMITAEMASRLNRAIGELPVKCGIIFRLVKEEGLSYKEVAQLLDVSEKTVENQIGIALKKIKQAICFKVPAGYV